MSSTSQGKNWKPGKAAGGPSKLASRSCSSVGVSYWRHSPVAGKSCGSSRPSPRPLLPTFLFTLAPGLGHNVSPSLPLPIPRSPGRKVHELNRIKDSIDFEPAPDSQMLWLLANWWQLFWGGRSLLGPSLEGPRRLNCLCLPPGLLLLLEWRPLESLGADLLFFTVEVMVPI